MTKNDPICQVMVQLLRFTPAHETDGTAVFGVTTFPSGLTRDYRSPSVIIRYDAAISVNKLPAGMTLPVATIDQLVGADGKIEACGIVITTGSVALDKLACTHATDLPIAAILDTLGNRVRGVSRQVILFVTPNAVHAPRD